MQTLVSFQKRRAIMCSKLAWMLAYMFSALFGNDNLIDKASKAIDASVLTNEEKMQYFIEYQKSTLPQNVARRLLALMIVGVFLFLVVLSIALYKVDLEYSQFIFKMVNDVVAMVTSVIIGFYFLNRFSVGDFR